MLIVGGKAIPEVLTTDPQEFNAGDNVQWITPADGYKGVDGYAVEYTFINADFKFSPSASVALPAGGFLISINSELSATIPPGDYKFQSYATKSGERFPLSSGNTKVNPNFAGQTDGYDARTDAEKMLDAINKTLIGKASKDQMSMSLAGRSLSRMSPNDLWIWRDKLRAEVARERGIRRKIRTRL